MIGLRAAFRRQKYGQPAARGAAGVVGGKISPVDRAAPLRPRRRFQGKGRRRHAQQRAAGAVDDVAQRRVNDVPSGGQLREARSGRDENRDGGRFSSSGRPPDAHQAHDHGREGPARIHEGQDARTTLEALVAHVREDFRGGRRRGDGDEEGPGAPEARLFCREEGLLQRGCLTTVAEDSNEHDGEARAADAPDSRRQRPFGRHPRARDLHSYQKRHRRLRVALH
mmetsp:Transcript_3294/g.10077  ORF Transcript_3294/g.10077 Transcript_3294/m.10077 type:complete len:225 (+) Transcript_3294:176-850(+)